MLQPHMEHPLAKLATSLLLRSLIGKTRPFLRWYYAGSLTRREAARLDSAPLYVQRLRRHLIKSLCSGVSTLLLFNFPQAAEGAAQVRDGNRAAHHQSDIQNLQQLSPRRPFFPAASRW